MTEFDKDGLKILEIMDKSPLSSKSDKIKEGVIITHIDGKPILKGEKNLPLGVQIIGKQFEDLSMLNHAKIFNN